MPWQVSRLPKVEDDLEGLGLDGGSLRRLLEAIEDEFAGMKGDRVTRFFRQGTASASLDRLEGSAYPGSIRLQLFADHRATALCLPRFEHAFVTHVFHKSRDPKYRAALQVHDARVGEFVEPFADFARRRR